MGWIPWSSEHSGGYQCQVAYDRVRRPVGWRRALFTDRIMRTESCARSWVYRSLYSIFQLEDSSHEEPSVASSYYRWTRNAQCTPCAQSLLHICFKSHEESALVSYECICRIRFWSMYCGVFPRPDPPHLITQKLQVIRNKHFPMYPRYFRADMLTLGCGIYDSRKKRDGGL